MNERLTGRMRLRSHSSISWLTRFAVLVLQVEVTRDDGPPDHNGMPEYLAATYWRDATAEDLSVVHFPFPLAAGSTP